MDMIALSLPSMHFTSLYENDLLSQLANDTVLLAPLPPEVSADEILKRIYAAADIFQMGSLRTVELSDNDNSQNALLASIAAALSLTTADYADAASLVLSNTDVLRFPYILIVHVVGCPSESDVREVVAICRALADITKDLEGPLKFIIILPFPTGFGLLKEKSKKWDPAIPQPLPINFNRPSISIESAGFNIYLYFRFYWESSGRLELIQQLSEYTEKALTFIQREDADDRIDNMMKDILSDRGGNDSLLVQIFNEQFSAQQGRFILLNGFLKNGTSDNLTDLVTSGLAWCPPGSFHTYITPLAANLLCKNSNFKARWALDDSTSENFIRATRVNPLLGTWSMGLTSLVEVEMLSRCRTCPNIDELIASLQFKKELEEYRQRARHHMMYHPKTDLIEYASFYHLQQFIFHRSFLQNFPLSRDRVNQIRDARNLLAHLHPVRWSVLRTILQSLSNLSSISGE